MTAYITKHALTKGIYEIEADIIDHDKRIIRRTVDGNGINDYYTGRDWHKDKDEAVKEARRMREESIKSKRRQLLRLEIEIKELNKKVFG